MPVTQLTQNLKQPENGRSAEPHIPFKIHNRKFRVALPSVEDADGDDYETQSPKTQLRRRRLSCSGQTLYTHLDAYSRFFARGLDVKEHFGGLSNTYLRSNAQFQGEQQSGCARYDIRVVFKSVDLMSSVVTGFFYISGLTDEHPLITTCFKGEIINNPLSRHAMYANRVKKYSFITEEKNWSSFPKNDLDHWKKLTGLPSNYTEEDLRRKLQKIQSGNDDPLLIYMRWKEEFLLPDSRVKLLTGASFEGFYYIVLNIGLGGGSDMAVLKSEQKLVPGTMNGLYFYTQSEKFQSLSLNYVEERGVPPPYSFA